MIPGAAFIVFKYLFICLFVVNANVHSVLSIDLLPALFVLLRKFIWYKVTGATNAQEMISQLACNHHHHHHTMLAHDVANGGSLDLLIPEDRFVEELPFFHGNGENLAVEKANVVR